MNSILLVSTLLLAAGDKAKKPDDTNLQCGLYCLYVGMIALDVDAKLDDVESRLGMPQAGGYSLADLKRVAEANGLKTLAVRTTAENLARRNERFACIAHVRGHHFVDVTDVDLTKGLVTYIDPPRPKQSVPLMVFNSQWDGYALLISKETMESEESVAARAPWLNLTSQQLIGLALLSLAVISILFATFKFLRRRKAETVAVAILMCLLSQGCGPNAKTEPIAEKAPPSLLIVEPQLDFVEFTVSAAGRPAFFEVQNRGEEPLLIDEIHSTCGCAVPKAVKKEVAPGETRRIEVNLRASQPEDHQARVTLKTNDPLFPVQSVELHWRVRAPIEFEPPRWEVDNVRPGAEVRRTITLVRREVPGSKVGEAADFSSSPQEVIAVEGLRLAEDGRSDLVDLVLRAGDESGTFHGMVAARLAGGAQESLYLPVNWTVVPEYLPTPQRIFLGVSSPGAELTGRFVVSTDLDCGLKIAGCGGLKSFEAGRFEVKPTGDRSATITFTLSAPETEGVFRDEIEVQFDDGKTVTVPVSGIVQTSATASTGT